MAAKARICWRELRRALSVLLVPAAILTTCAVALSTKPSAPPRELTQAERDERMHRIARQNVIERLRDGESAKFRNQFIGHGGVPCGEVNAKNAFGGYAGYTRFVASGGGLAVLESDMKEGEFDEVWYRLCR